MYRFTTKLSHNTCRICGSTFSEKWSSGGVGGFCENCFEERMEMDLVEIGIVRNIVPVVRSYSRYPSYSFEALIDDTWYKCSLPCGNWSHVDDRFDIFSVPVGYWELDRLYKKHYELDLDLDEGTKEN